MIGLLVDLPVGLLEQAGRWRIERVRGDRRPATLHLFGRTGDGGRVFAIAGDFRTLGPSVQRRTNNEQWTRTPVHFALEDEREFGHGTKEVNGMMLTSASSSGEGGRA